MKFFRSMSKREHENWKKGAIFGFYTYMLLLFINYICDVLFKSEPFTSMMIFWSGLLAAFGYELIVNLLYKVKVKREANSPNS